MKLLRLQLNSPFRSLAQGFEVNFLREWGQDRINEFHPYCLVGRNGSGKSNVLEALAAIFYHIECIYLDYRPDDFEYDTETSKGSFRSEDCGPDAFELEYLIPLAIDDFDFVTSDELGDYRSRDLDHAHVCITKASGESPKLSCKNLAFFNDEDGFLSRDRVKKLLPDFIVGYSSGHNEVLSLPFFKMRFIHYDEYFDKLTKDLDYRGRPEGRMLYIDKQFSQAILLCHFLFPSEPILNVFRDKIQLRDIRKIRIIINRSKVVRAREVRDGGFFTSELTRIQEDFIDKLRACATCSFEEEVRNMQDGEMGHVLYLDYWIDDATRAAFQAHFGKTVSEDKDVNLAESALNLFQSFQTLLTLNHYQVNETTKIELYNSKSLYVDETIPTPASHERIIRFKEGELVKENIAEPLYLKSLSDGEYQLLHTIGLCLLFRHKKTLFLLDEPETYLNPDWRASYISTLRQALETGEKINVTREVLLTSHSPFIVSDCDKENVLVFEKDKDTKEATYHRPDFQTFGASANTITLKVFKQRETIGSFALETLQKLQQRLVDGESPERVMADASRLLGDSIEKVMLMNQAIDKQEGL